MRRSHWPILVGIGVRIADDAGHVGMYAAQLAGDTAPEILAGDHLQNGVRGEEEAVLLLQPANPGRSEDRAHDANEYRRSATLNHDDESPHAVIPVSRTLPFNCPQYVIHYINDMEYQYFGSQRIPCTDTSVSIAERKLGTEQQRC